MKEDKSLKWKKEILKEKKCPRRPLLGSKRGGSDESLRGVTGEVVALESLDCSLEPRKIY
jgi:hypothetical protein